MSIKERAIKLGIVALILGSIWLIIAFAEYAKIVAGVFAILIIGAIIYSIAFGSWDGSDGLG